MHRVVPRTIVCVFLAASFAAGSAPAGAGPTSPAEVIAQVAEGASANRPAVRGQRIAAPVPAVVQIVLDYALAQQGKGYVFNTAGPDTFDCSGLALAAYAQIGISLPHQSGAQALSGVAVDWLHEPIVAGDLVFTAGSTGTMVISHVGIALDATRWVHATNPGDVVKVATLPASSKILAVRRIVQP